MPYPAVQSQAVQEVIGHNGEHLSGALVRRKGVLGATVESSTTFKVGTIPSNRLDAQERVSQRKAKDRWIIESCNTIIDWTNSLIREGKLSGHEFIGEKRAEHLADCVNHVRSGKQ